MNTEYESEKYYEIEYDSCPIPGVGRFVEKTQKIKPREMDETQKLFRQMKDVASATHGGFVRDRYYDRSIQQYNAAVFYRQAVFMKDFSDDYEESVPCSQYYPCYQNMTDAQLRTYFTWRTKVRQGSIKETSLSYAFLYLYELLNNIGVDNPEDGLKKLLDFRTSYYEINKSLDKYIIHWFKDYHIYYELPHSFREFVKLNKLEDYYPELKQDHDEFAVFLTMSGYNIRKSSFYTEENSLLIHDCFIYTLDSIRSAYEEKGINFDNMIFQSDSIKPVWTPFRAALFYPHSRQSDRYVILTDNEVYECRNGIWTYRYGPVSDRHKKLIGIIFKQMEVSLRNIIGYKYKLKIKEDELKKASADIGIDLEAVILKAVLNYNRELNKVVVQVNDNALIRIREDSRVTQERLTVEDEASGYEDKLKIETALTEVDNRPQTVLDKADLNTKTVSNKTEIPPGAVQCEEPKAINEAVSEWSIFIKQLTDVEFETLSETLKGKSDLMRCSKKYEIMPEVLADGINEKAMDSIGDNLMDEDFIIYEEYLDYLRELVD